MSILSKLLDVIKAIIKKVVKSIIDFIKKYWVIILLLVVIWFAPAIAGWLLSSGGPAWLSTAFTWIGTTVTPSLISIGTSVWNGVVAVGSKAWSAFTSASFGTQTALLTGAGLMIAPEETEALLEEVAETAVDVIGTVAGTVVEGLGLAGLLPYALLGAGAYFLFLRNPNANSKETIVLTDSEDPNE